MMKEDDEGFGYGRRGHETAKQAPLRFTGLLEERERRRRGEGS